MLLSLYSSWVSPGARAKQREDPLPVYSEENDCALLCCGHNRNKYHKLGIKIKVYPIVLHVWSSMGFIGLSCFPSWRLQGESFSSPSLLEAADIHRHVASSSVFKASHVAPERSYFPHHVSLWPQLGKALCFPKIQVVRTDPPRKSRLISYMRVPNINLVYKIPSAEKIVTSYRDAEIRVYTLVFLGGRGASFCLPQWESISVSFSGIRDFWKWINSSYTYFQILIRKQYHL